MQLAAEFFSDTTLASIGSVYGVIVGAALWYAPWQRISQHSKLHVYAGALVTVLLLWMVRTEPERGIVYHTLGMTSLTLMFGWCLAVIGGTLVMFMQMGFGVIGWGEMVLSGIVEVLVPASATIFLLAAVRSYLPKHFFIFVFINAFFGGGIAALLNGLSAVGLLLLFGEVGTEKAADWILPILPLMMFPEGFLNGLAMAMLAATKPEWVYSFVDREYLDK